MFYSPVCHMGLERIQKSKWCNQAITPIRLFSGKLMGFFDALQLPSAPSRADLAGVKSGPDSWLFGMPLVKMSMLR